MESKKTDTSSDLDNDTKAKVDVSEQALGTDLFLSSGRSNDRYESLPHLSTQASLQPESESYPDPQPQSYQGPNYHIQVRHFRPKTLVMTAGPCEHCRSEYFNLDEDSSPTAASTPLPSSSPAGNDQSSGRSEVDTDGIIAQTDGLERHSLELMETVRRLVQERDALRRRIEYLERRLGIIEELGLYSRSPNGSDREPLLGNGSWEDVDRDTELEAGSVSD
ncbi:hypothetical protein F4806DRAFT_326492 [Annulohypoxylon nitens]|nr:hypothetical protein F4806DRAFT_326492 [Annulohypoxylon nitens]